MQPTDIGSGLKALQQQRREKLRKIMTDLRSTKAKLADMEKRAAQDAQKKSSEAARAVSDKSQQKIAELERHIALLTRAYQDLDGAIKRIPPPQPAPSQNHSHKVIVDTAPISLEVSRLSEIVGSLMKPKPQGSVRLIHKRNEFGQITETIVEPLDESDETT